MKANKSSQLRYNDKGYAKIIGGIVALLLTIIIGIMVYWSVSPNLISSDAQVETFTGYTLPVGSDSQGSNSTAWYVTVTEIPKSSSDTNVTCYNATGVSESWPTFTLSHTRIDVAADAADGFSQVNVSYTTRASDVASSTNTQASTVFELIPIVAIVVIGSIMIGLVVGFGASGKKP